MKCKLAVLASGAGSTLNDLLILQEKGKLHHQISLLITNNPQAGALTIAKDHQIKSRCLEPEKYSSFAEWDQAVLEALSAAQIDIVLLAGFLKKVGPQVLKKFHGRVINTHPSLLPKYGGKGMYGSRVHQAVRASGDTEAGVTIHMVDEHYDNGQILKQMKIPISPTETAESIEERVKALEKKTLFEFLNNWEMAPLEGKK